MTSFHSWDEAKEEVFDAEDLHEISAGALFGRSAVSYQVFVSPTSGSTVEVTRPRASYAYDQVLPAGSFTVSR